MKKEEYINWTNYIFTGATLITLGIIIIIGSQKLYQNVIHLLVISFLLLGLSQFITFLVNRKKKNQKEKGIRAIINVFFAFVMLIFPNISLSIVPILFAIYLLFNGIVKIINYLIYKKNHLKGKWTELFLANFFSITGIIFLFSPLYHLPTILAIIGGYCILLGLGEGKQLISELISQKSKTKLKRKIRISLPTFLDAFIPRKVLSELNKYFNDLKDESEWIYQEEKENKEPDLEIFIHVAPQGFNQFGHMDIYFDEKIISYGNYDKSSYRMFDSIGDGVLFETKKETYIPLCIKESNKTLIGFGLKLTEKQKNKVRKELENIKEEAISWEPMAKRDHKIGKKEKRSKYKEDYASLLYLETNAKFYKFKSGKFKTYFVLGTNCTLFADRIVGKTGTDILKMVGIVTPGTYFDYLNHEFHKKNSMVISKTIYNEETQKKTIKKTK